MHMMNITLVVRKKSSKKENCTWSVKALQLSVIYTESNL